MALSMTPRGYQSAGARIRARICAARLDRQIEAGTCDMVTPTLATHIERITSRAEREKLATALRIAQSAPSGTVVFHVPVHAAAVRAAAEWVDELIGRLSGPSTVSARGMARLRILLADARGPLYRPGPGTLTAALRGVLAAL
ncbi:hypothetical protein [Mycolicibacterium canariasense]|nr:hypothetical protein [Mycolicibacterium canariasense]MCV7210434.1 hypothetical protein [Mycolicibacterium canariasense]